MATLEPTEPVEPTSVPATDDTLTLLLLCCHPSLTTVSQVALTLRAVGGLSTAEIARALLVPEATVAQRISRAKARIKADGAEFRMPPPEERAERVAAVLHVLYLIFNEGYTASSGPALNRVELSAEAIRLTRQLHTQLPNPGHHSRTADLGDSSGTGGSETDGTGGTGETGGSGHGGSGGSGDVRSADGGRTGGEGVGGEVAGLLALMLLTDARRPARTRGDGALVPLAEQDRALWDAAAIAEGTALVTHTLATAPIGPYQLQAAIAAVHDEAERAEDTDWRQILGLYELLETLTPGPMITLNRIVAYAMVHGPSAGLDLLADQAPDLGDHHRVHAVRAHLLERAGDRAAARAAYERAAQRTLSIPEQRYLTSKATQLTDL